MITVKDLVKRYAGVECLRGVSLRFARGEVVALVGPSGSGKSTLLRCMNGLETFDAGQITVEDRTLGPGRADTETLLAIRRRVGLVFQHYNLFAHKTALENIVEAPIHVNRIPRGDARARARALLAKVKLRHLLDEPTSALDPDRKGEVLAVLTDLAREGTTMIVVTHEVRFAREVAHRAIALEAGCVVEDGSPESVLAKRTA
jgi:polar amino acid transport system ATP-binding protein